MPINGGSPGLGKPQSLGERKWEEIFRKKCGRRIPLAKRIRSSSRRATRLRTLTPASVCQKMNNQNSTRPHEKTNASKPELRTFHACVSRPESYYKQTRGVRNLCASRVSHAKKLGAAFSLHQHELALRSVFDD